MLVPKESNSHEIHKQIRIYLFEYVHISNKENT